MDHGPKQSGNNTYSIYNVVACV